MKTRVITTGEIVEVEFVERKTHTGEQVYMTHEGCLIEESRLDFSVELDYWTRLEHQYAGMAMQRLCANSGWDDCTWETTAEDAISAAHALVQKLKKKEERK